MVNYVGIRLSVDDIVTVTVEARQVRVRANDPPRPDPVEGGSPAQGAEAGKVPHSSSPAASTSRCPECGRVYWEGSHTERMRKVIDGIFTD